MRQSPLILLLMLSVFALSCTKANVETKEQNEIFNENIDEKKTADNYNGNILAGTESKYIEFNKEDYDKALNEKKIILLYFYADWCPICKAEQPETLAAFNELNNPDLIGFRVNYNDKFTDADETGLAKQFGITYQHTKVILNDKKQVLKALDSWNKQRYLDELAKIK